MALSFLWVALPAKEFHLSLNGDDAADGSSSHPLVTIGKAQEVVRAFLKNNKTEVVKVVLHAGTWRVKDSVVFNATDSGTPNATVTWCGAENEVVEINASVNVSLEKMRKVSATPLAKRFSPELGEKIRTIDLAALGIKHAKAYPDLFVGRGNIIDVTWAANRMTLSRYPKKGYALIKRVLDKGVWQGENKHGGVFEYNEKEMGDWKAEDGIWLDGFWRVPWDNQSVRVSKVDPEAHTFSLSVPVVNGIGSKYGGAEGSGKENYCAINRVDSLSEPGEWAIDFASQTLLLIPPTTGGNEVEICDLENPVVIFQEVSNFNFENLSVRGGLGNGLEIRGGEKVCLGGLRVFLNAGNGVVMTNGFRNKVDSCDLYDLGEAGVLVAGGDRRDLTPCEHEVVNCDIHHFARLRKTYAAGIDVGFSVLIKVPPVGVVLSHNRIHDTPHAGVLYSGNEHLFEYNELYHLGLDSHDVGGFYTCNDWTSRGNVLRFNFIHSSPAINGVYLDDGDSGDSVVSNFFWRTDVGTFISGGHDNHVVGNIMLDCRVGSHADARGISRKYDKDAGLLRKLSSTPVSSPIWSAKYPSLSELLSHHPEKPSDDNIEENVYVLCPLTTRLSGKPAELDGVKVAGNQNFTSDPGLLDLLTGKNSSENFLAENNLPPLPFGKIGLYLNRFRKTLSPRIDPGLIQTDEGIRSEDDMEKSNKK
jgi:hypothetical protein